MKSHVVLEGVRLFGVKPLGQGCRFGIKVSSKKQDGTYTKGTFLNCKHNKMLEEGINYSLTGFFGDNEYSGNNTLEFIVTMATPEQGQSKPPLQVNRTQKQQDSDFDDEILF